MPFDQGYEMTHPDIKLLRLRNFTVGKKVDDGMFCRDDAQEKLTDIIRALYPFVSSRYCTVDTQLIYIPGNFLEFGGHAGSRRGER